MIIGNNEQFNGLGCVCFIDVLGFSNEILENWNNKEADPLKKILSIKNKMPLIYPDISLEINDKSVRSYACRVNTVSDSVTICFGYNTEPTFMVGDLVLGLESVIANIAYVWATFIREGFTIRGAIDIGDIYWDENELIGPAFIRAYQLESQVAKTSRVVISPGMNKELRNLAANYASSLTESLFRKLRKDVDGYIIVNPAILYRTDDEKDDLVDRLEKMKKSVSSGIIKEKYSPLIHMLKTESNETLRADSFGCY